MRGGLSLFAVRCSLFVGLLCAAVLRPSPAMAGTADDNLRNHFSSLFQEAAARRIRPALPGPPRAPTGEWELLRADIDAEVDPRAGTLRSTAELTILNQSTRSLGTLSFVVNGLAVDSVRDATGTLVYTFDGMQLDVTLRTTLAPGTRTALTFGLSGTPACDEYCAIGPEITYLGLSDLMPLDMEALSGIYDDAYTSSLRLVAPAGQVVLASGVAGPEEPLPDGRIAHNFSLPNTGLYGGIAAAEYETTATTSGIPCRIGTLPGHGIYDDVLLQIAPQALEIYGGVFFPYLYDHLDVAEIPYVSSALAFGLESLVWYVAPHESGDPSAPFGELTLSHEIGHQWWANMVPVGETEAPWLAEGFAEYSTFVFLEHTGGPPRSYRPEEVATFRGIHVSYYDYLDYFTSEDPPLTSSEILTADGNAYTIVTYLKGAMVVEALRHVVGATRFTTDLQGYIPGHREDPVSTEDLQAAMEAGTVLGSLDWFFDAWVYGSGMPTYTADVRIAPGRTTVTLVLDDRRFTRMPVSWTSPAVGDEVCQGTFDEVPGTATGEASCNEPPWITIDPDVSFPRAIRSTLDGDIRLSGDVDGFDLIAAAWANGSSFSEYADNWDAQADLDRDAYVTELDVSTVMSQFGARL